MAEGRGVGRGKVGGGGSRLKPTLVLAVRGGGAGAVAVLSGRRRSSDGSCQTNRGRREEEKGRRVTAVPEVVAVVGGREGGSVELVGVGGRLDPLQFPVSAGTSGSPMMFML